MCHLAVFVCIAFFFPQSLSKNVSLATGCSGGDTQAVGLESEGLENQEMLSCSCIIP